MKSSDVFPSKYLKSEELDGDLSLTIREVIMETLASREKGEESKPVCYFDEIEKGLILNKTNWSLIAKQHGDESNDWAGKAVTLTVIDVDAFGDVVSAIRIKPPRKQADKVVVKPKSEVSNGGAKLGGDPVTQFWATCGERGLIGKDILAKHGGDFKAALESLTVKAA